MSYIMLIYYRYIVVNTVLFKYMQHYYSSSDVQSGIVQFYNKIASRLMNGNILFI